MGYISLPEKPPYRYSSPFSGGGSAVSFSSFACRRQENKNVKDRLRRIVKEVLGWTEDVSSTWARHSFATNMRNAGVDMQYISDSMGHSTNKTVTEIYLASYPLSVQMDNNNKLLDLEPKKESNMVDINNLTAEQKMQLIKQLLG